MLKLGLIDQVVVNLVPEVLGSGRPFFATGALAEPQLTDEIGASVRSDPTTTREKKVGTTMKLTTNTNVSVDGVMQGLGGPEEDRRGGFERGG